jgi:hypothetical protein
VRRKRYDGKGGKQYSRRDQEMSFHDASLPY